MSKPKLSTKELNAIEHATCEYEILIKRLETVKQFKVGDYFITKGVVDYNEETDNSIYDVLTNSYGAVTKYVVVHVTPSGIPFAKKLNAGGKPVGPLTSMVGGLGDTSIHIDHFENEIEFELDPEFAEAIILDSTSEYDPAGAHKSKKELFADIAKHNKAAKIDTHGGDKVNDFFLKLNVGDMFWQSPNSFFLVKNKVIETKGSPNFHRVRYLTGKRMSQVAVLTVEDKRGNQKTVTGPDFAYKALYSQKPRSYKELKI